MIETLQFVAIVVLVAFGLFFTLVSAVGVIRLPDVYSRAHTASQTDTLGAGMALAAVAVALGYQNATIYTVLLLFFVFITNPTAAHAIARSAAETGIEPWTGDDETDGGPARADGGASLAPDDESDAPAVDDPDAAAVDDPDAAAGGDPDAASGEGGDRE